MIKIILETPRLIVREFSADDLEALIDLDSDPEVMFFITGGRSTPPAEIRDEILPHYLDYHRRGSPYGFFAAERRETGEFVGWFHLRPGPDDGPDEPELGYRLKRSAWGRGLASEGAKALVDKAFREDGATRIRAETMAINLASRRVMEKSGLRYVRTFFADWPDKIPGDEHGDVEYAITREQWLATTPAGP